MNFNKFSFPIGMSCLLFMVFFSFSSEASQFRITNVYDGDTVKAENRAVVIYIMLVGIDAPEIGYQKGNRTQPFGEEAKRFLTELLLDNLVFVEGYGSAPYPHENILGVVYLNGLNVNLEMVKRGLAEVQKGKPPKGLHLLPFLEAEAEAKEKAIGIWSLGDDYVSPEQWRRKSRQR